MMKKTVSIGIVSLFAIGGLVGILITVPDEVEGPGPTYVSGLIEENTTWTSDNSPYHIIDNTTLMSGYTLTIEAGTEVKFANNTILKIRGALHVTGNSSDRVVFTNYDPLFDYQRIYYNSFEDKSYYYNGSGVNYNIHIDLSNGGHINISYAKFEFSAHEDGAIILDENNDKDHLITDTLFINNDNGIRGGDYDSLVIRRCTFIDNYNGIGGARGILCDSLFQNNTIGICGGNPLKVYNCSLIENSYGVWGHIDMEYCKIAYNEIGYSGEYYVVYITNTSIHDNRIGLVFPYTSVTNVHYNNIYNNAEYNLIIRSDWDRDVTNNWWGTTNTNIIDQYIFDIYDNLSLGEAIYNPFLYEPNPNAPGFGTGLQEGAPWPMFRGNVRHTGLSPYDTSGNPGELKWSFETGDYIISSPAIDSDGTIYFGSFDQKLYAVYPNGTEKWSFTCDYYVPSSPAISSDGTIIVGSQDHKVYAINPNGTEKWNFMTGNIIYSSPAIGSDGTIFIGSDDYKLYAIFPNGTEKWNFQTEAYIEAAPAIGPDGTIYIGSEDSKFYAINPNGTKKWSFLTGDYVESSPAIDSDGTIYVGSTDNRLYAINPNGTEKWNFTTGFRVFSSPAIGPEGTVYVGSGDYKLYAINPDGTEKWNFTTGWHVWTSPAIGSDGTIYFYSVDDKFYAINPDGTEKWNISLLGGAYSSPAIGSDGTIYVGSYANKLYAIGEAPNQSPTPPTTPSGLTSGLTNTSYSFYTSTTDPEGDQIKYGWDWDGDETVDEWSSLVDSGTEDNRSHSWSTAGIYDVKVKAQDEFGAESDWSEALTVTISEPPVPESPEIIGTIPDVILNEDFGSYQIYLSAFASDPQDPLSELKWYLTGVEPSIISISGENQTGNHILSLISQDNMFGHMWVTYWLVDSESNTASQNAWINVTPVNDYPIINICPAIAVYVNTPYTYNYTPYINDVDTPLFELLLTCNDTAHTTVVGLLITYLFPESMAGQTVLVNLMVSDGFGNDNDTIEIIIIEKLDTDGDGIPDSEDEDDDNDGYNDDNDTFPLDPDEYIDTDSDGIGNNADFDDDNDGYNDENDQFPLDPLEWLDTDLDGIGDNTDQDDDNDGYNDDEDYYPLDPTRWSLESDLTISSITLSKYGPSAGDEVTIYVEIQNNGDNDREAIVRFYDGDPTIGGAQIGSDQNILIPSQYTATVSVEWTTTAGNHTIYVIVENVETGEKYSAFLQIKIGEGIQPILILTTGDINIFRFEPGEERTIAVEVTCYLQTVNNVHLVVLDDQNLTIDHTITPPRTMIDGETIKFYLRITAPQLPEGVEKLEKDILIQAVGENGIFSNAEELDIVVSQSAVTFLNPITIAGAVVTGSLATLGAAAAASRRNENWKYLLLLTFAVPLFTRIHGKKTLDNFVRGQVYGHIQSKPGTHFNEIRKTLKLGNGNLAYHLNKLEKEGFIKSKRDKRFRRFYPIGVEVPEEDGIKLSKTQETILDYIERHPKSGQKEIASELKESQQTISYNINILVREGFLKEEKFKGTKRYEIMDENT